MKFVRTLVLLAGLTATLCSQATARSSAIAQIPGLVAECAPRVHPQTLTAIVQVESSGWDWTINDNIDGQAYFDASYDASLARATALMRAGHDNLDLGVAQVNSRNLPGLGETVASALLPCRSIAAGAHILINCERKAIQHFGEAFAARYPSYTVRFAVSCYNTGSLFAGAGYVSKVLDAANTLGTLPDYAVRGGQPRAVYAFGAHREVPAVHVSLARPRPGRDMVVEMITPTYYAAPLVHAKMKKARR